MMYILTQFLKVLKEEKPNQHLERGLPGGPVVNDLLPVKGCGFDSWLGT